MEAEYTQTPEVKSDSEIISNAIRTHKNFVPDTFSNIDWLLTDFEKLSKQHPDKKDVLLEIATTGGINGEVNDDFPGLSKNYKWSDYINSRIFLINLYARNPELTEQMCADHITGLHGTKSGTLVSVLEHGLVPLSYARDKGVDVVTGERILSDAPRMGTVSFIEPYNPDAISNYFRDTGPNTVEDVQKSVSRLERLVGSLDHIPEYQDDVIKTIEDERKLIALLTSNPTNTLERQRIDLIRDNFPVIYGVGPVGITEGTDGKPIDPSQNKQIIKPIVGIDKEFALIGGTPPENIKIIFVPKEQVGRVRALVEEMNRNINVYALEDFYPPREKPKNQDTHQTKKFNPFKFFRKR